VRNAEAARYARWAATVSVLIVTLTAGVYIRRAWRASHTGGETPEPIPDSVQQRSAVFSHSKVELNKTIYTIRASQATEFKEHSLLQDVWITIYGKEGARNDNIHTRECSYEPGSGNIRCQGSVQIDLESADQAKEPGHPHVMHVKTQDFSFDEKTGDARSDHPVEIQFPGGSGIGRGLTYNASRTDLRLEHDVEFQMGSPNDPSAPVTTFTGSALDFQRNISTAQLFGPVRVTQSGRVLTAGLLTLLLDAEMHARHVRASDHPLLHSDDLQGTAKGSIEVSSDQMDADLNAAGWVQQAQFSGNVRAHRRSAKDNANFTAPQAVLAMEPRDNLLRSVTASGGVHVDMRSGTDTPAGPQSRTLDTAALRLDFHSISDPDPRSQISAAETLAPGVIGLDSPGENTQVHAAKFNAHFDAAGRFDWLEGHSGTEINRQIKSDPPQKITARDLTVTFANDGGWSNLKLDRNVRFHQADRTAECDRATIAHATNLIHLDGSPAVADATTRTTADAIEISQSTNDIHAESSVITTYRNSTPDKAPDIGAGIAHISSDTLAGNGASGHLIYSGHARYWQGDTALNADVIEITRAQNRIDAHGNVVAALPQLPGPGLQGTSPGNKPTRPVIWDVRAPVLHYWNDTGKGLLEGGVNATSTQGALHSETLDLFLAPANQTAPAAQPQTASQPGTAYQPPKSKGAPASATPKPAPAVATQGRQLERAVAQGSVVVQQGERRGMADQGVYTASDGRYVLSGGDPTIVDAGSDTTTQGHSLTFYVASDTILIDAQAGSKTLTKHRVEK
jgi:lipopolysaccharide export system protein LptA